MLLAVSSRSQSSATREVRAIMHLCGSAHNHMALSGHAYPTTTPFDVHLCRRQEVSYACSWDGPNWESPLVLALPDPARLAKQCVRRGTRGKAPSRTYAGRGPCVPEPSPAQSPAFQPGVRSRDGHRCALCWRLLGRPPHGRRQPPSRSAQRAHRRSRAACR